MCHEGCSRFDYSESKDRVAALSAETADDEAMRFYSMPDLAVSTLGSFSDLERAPTC